SLTGQPDDAAVANPGRNLDRQPVDLPVALQRNVVVAAGCCQLKWNLDFTLDVGTTSRALPPTTARRLPAAKRSAEQVSQVDLSAENVSQIDRSRSLEAAPPEWTSARRRAPFHVLEGFAVLVVLLAFFGVSEDVVGFGRLFEPLGRRRIARLHVRVVFARNLLVGLAD